MIISRTPLRASFCGGGTDIDSFSHAEEEGGMVVSTTLQSYIHITVNKRFDDRVRVSYSKMELVDDFEDLEHELVREAMRITGITAGVEITTIADIPSRGTGLGSSSSVTVGLLNALHAFAGHHASPKQLAEEACMIEIEILNQPIGRQDQYAAAFGGINSILFTADSVEVMPLKINKNIINRMETEFSLVFTGLSRSASKILSESSDSQEAKFKRLRLIRNQALSSINMLENGELEELGKLLVNTWELKRQLSQSVSNDELDIIYDNLIDLGANGAKLLGAGGGGFFLVHGSPEFRKKLILNFGKDYKILPLKLDFYGSQIIYNAI
jgi:D-glycero-alpha-D-manno-heptose-7-phosphate kinase